MPLISLSQVAGFDVTLPGRFWVPANILEAVFVRFVIDDKRVVESVLRPPYNWIADAVGGEGVEFVTDAINVNGSRSSGRQQSDVWW